MINDLTKVNDLNSIDQPILFNCKLSRRRKRCFDERNNVLDARDESLEECCTNHSKVIPLPKNQDIFQNKDDSLKGKLDNWKKYDKHYPDFKETQFKTVSVEDFGYALIRGMGWKETRNLGGNDCLEIKPRPLLLGLGADSKTNKPSEYSNFSSNKKNACQKKTNDIDVGSFLKIHNGSYRGSFAITKQVDGVPGLNNISVYMSSDSSPGFCVEIVKSEDVYKIDSDLNEGHPLLSLLLRVKQKELNDIEVKKKKTRQKAVNFFNKNEKLAHSNCLASKNEEPTYHLNYPNDAQKKMVTTWLLPGIRVRIVCPLMSQYYMLKGVVEDVQLNIQPSCTLIVTQANNKKVVLENVLQSKLHTVIPRQGGKVIVLHGKYTNWTGILISKDNKLNSAMVQLEDNMQVLNFPYEHIAEFSSYLN